MGLFGHITASSLYPTPQKVVEDSSQELLAKEEFTLNFIKC